MEHMREIEIDLDIHKLIEIKRQSFSETPNTVLRRILGLKELKEPLSLSQSKFENGAWTGKRVTLPAGTQIRMEYRGEQLLGVIKDASWIVGGKKYKSPSAAASGSARTKAGTRPSLDGWKYWFIKRPGEDTWIPLSSLRK